jgi:hypothetical protein
MASSSGPSVGGLATRTSSSAAVDIPQTKGCRRSCLCGCDCMKCSCRTRLIIIDSNRDEYGGEGTHLAVGALAPTQSRSYASVNSVGSVKESSDAPLPVGAAIVAPPSYDIIRSVHGRQDQTRIAQTNMERFLNEPDDECPWEFFLEKSTTSDAVEDDSGPFGPMEIDGSMRNKATLDSGEQSMLSSFMSSLSPHTPSVGMSDAVRGAGGAFGSRGGAEPGHRYLRLN